MANRPTFFLCLFLHQLHNGTGSRFATSSSSSSALREGTVSTDHAGDIHITRAAPRVEPQESSDRQRYQDGADLGGGKRKLPSPEGAVRQAALPQPHSGRERREEVEEEEWLERGWGDRAVQTSESHMLQERQDLREEGHYPDCQRSRAFSGGKNSRGSSKYYPLCAKVRMSLIGACVVTQFILL